MWRRPPLEMHVEKREKKGKILCAHALQMARSPRVIVPVAVAAVLVAVASFFVRKSMTPTASGVALEDASPYLRTFRNSTCAPEPDAAFVPGWYAAATSLLLIPISFVASRSSVFPNLHTSGVFQLLLTTVHIISTALDRSSLEGSKCGRVVIDDFVSAAEAEAIVRLATHAFRITAWKTGAFR